MNNIIHWLFTDPISATGDTAHPEVFHFYVPWIVFCALGLLIPLYYWMEGRKRFFGSHTLNKAVADKIVNQLALFAFVGPFVIFGRWALDSSFFSWRIWRYLWLLWGVALVAVWGYYFAVRYRNQLASYRYYRTKQQYIPQPKPKKRSAARAGAR